MKSFFKNKQFYYARLIKSVKLKLIRIFLNKKLRINKKFTKGKIIA